MLSHSTPQSSLGNPEDFAVNDDDDGERQPECAKCREDCIGVVLTDAADTSLRVILFTCHKQTW